MFNRCAVVIRKKKPYLDWLLRLPDPVEPDTTLEQINDDSHVYLLPEYVYVSEQNDLIEEFLEVLFESELEGWWRQTDDWPSDRNLKMFNKWFDIEFHSCIEDLGDTPLIDDEGTSMSTLRSAIQRLTGWFKQ